MLGRTLPEGHCCRRKLRKQTLVGSGSWNLSWQPGFFFPSALLSWASLMYITGSVTLTPLTSAGPCLEAGLTSPLLPWAAWLFSAFLGTPRSTVAIPCYVPVISKSRALGRHHRFFISFLACLVKDGGAWQTLKRELSEMSNFCFSSTIFLFKNSKVS